MRLFRKHLVLATRFLFGCSALIAGDMRESKKAVTQWYAWETFSALNVEKLSKMSLDDPLLRAAYAQIFLRSGNNVNPWVYDVWADLRRRGNEATPLLLSLFEENPERQFQSDLLGKIENVSTISLEPFLNVARLLFQKEGLVLPVRTRFQMAWLFERHGTTADMDIIKQMNYDTSTDREHGLELNGNIRSMKERLAKEAAAKENAAHAPGPTALEARRVGPSARNLSQSTPSEDSASTSAVPAVVTVSEDSNVHGPSLYLWSGLAVALLGSGLWLFFHFRRRDAGDSQ